MIFPKKRLESGWHLFDGLQTNLGKLQKIEPGKSEGGQPNFPLKFNINNTISLPIFNKLCSTTAGVATFVQGTVVHGTVCPRRLLSKNTFFKGDINPVKTLAQGDSCPKRLLSKETITCNLVQGYFY